MSLAVAVQMDPIQAINIDADSTFVLMVEAQARGHGLWYYTPKTLSLSGGRVVAKAQRIKEIRRKKGDHVELGPVEPLDLSMMDVVLLRQDPPFDMGYITTTHVLERLPKRTLVVNDPYWVRNSPEKVFVTEFPDLMPATLITSDAEAIRAFRAEHGEIVVKPLYGNGGAGVFRVRPEDENLNTIMEFFAAFVREPLVVQRYEPKVREGDKRILLVDGEAVGAINRVGKEEPWAGKMGEFYGSSYIVNPRGKIEAQASYDKDELLVHTVDLDMVREVRNTWQFFRDRRPETYGPLV